MSLPNLSVIFLFFVVFFGSFFRWRISREKIALASNQKIIRNCVRFQHLPKPSWWKPIFCTKKQFLFPKKTVKTVLNKTLTNSAREVERETRFPRGAFDDHNFEPFILKVMNPSHECWGIPGAGSGHVRSVPLGRPRALALLNSEKMAGSDPALQRCKWRQSQPCWGHGRASAC